MNVIFEAYGTKVAHDSVNRLSNNNLMDKSLNYRENDKFFDRLYPYIKRTEVNHAIMVNGAWGRGKTHYFKNEFETKCKALDRNIYYTTANGAKDFDEILEQIKWQKIPLIKGKGKIIGKIGSIILDSSTISLILGSSIPYLAPIAKVLKDIGKGLKVVTNKKDSLLELLTFSNKDILVIDDLERVHKDCDLIGLLGQINTYFVEHNEVKTILISDEAILRDRFNPNRKERKLKGTEEDFQGAYTKVISRTIEFDLELKELISKLINSPRIQSVARANFHILKDENLNFLIDKIESAGIENLRDIFFYIENLVLALEAVSTENWDKLYKELCANSLVDSISSRNGTLKKSIVDEVDGSGKVFFRGDFFANQKVELTSQEKSIDKIRRDIGYYRQLDFTKRIAFYGKVDPIIVERAVELYSKDYNIDSEQSIVLQRLSNYTGYENNEKLDTDISKAFNFARKGELTIYQLIRFYSIIFILIENNVKHDKIGEHLEFAESAIEFLDEVELDIVRDSGILTTKDFFDLRFGESLEEYKLLRTKYEEKIKSFRSTSYEHFLELSLKGFLKGEEIEQGHQLLGMLSTKNAIDSIADAFIDDSKFKDHFIHSLGRLRLHPKSEYREKNNLDELLRLITEKSDDRNNVHRIAIFRVTQLLDDLRADGTIT